MSIINRIIRKNKEFAYNSSKAEPDLDTWFIESMKDISLRNNTKESYDKLGRKNRLKALIERKDIDGIIEHLNKNKDILFSEISASLNMIIAGLPKEEVKYILERTPLNLTNQALRQLYNTIYHFDKEYLPEFIAKKESEPSEALIIDFIERTKGMPKQDKISILVGIINSEYICYDEIKKPLLRNALKYVEEDQDLVRLIKKMQLDEDYILNQLANHIIKNNYGLSAYEFLSHYASFLIDEGETIDVNIIRLYEIMLDYANHYPEILPQIAADSNLNQLLSSSENMLELSEIITDRLTNIPTENMKFIQEGEITTINWTNEDYFNYANSLYYYAINKSESDKNKIADTLIKIYNKNLDDERIITIILNYANDIYNSPAFTSCILDYYTNSSKPLSNSENIIRFIQKNPLDIFITFVECAVKLNDIDILLKFFERLNENQPVGDRIDANNLELFEKQTFLVRKIDAYLLDHIDLIEHITKFIKLAINTYHLSVIHNLSCENFLVVLKNLDAKDYEKFKNNVPLFEYTKMIVNGKNINQIASLISIPYINLKKLIQQLLKLNDVSLIRKLIEICPIILSDAIIKYFIDYEENAQLTDYLLNGKISNWKLAINGLTKNEDIFSLIKCLENASKISEEEGVQDYILSCIYSLSYSKETLKNLLDYENFIICNIDEVLNSGLAGIISIEDKPINKTLIAKYFKQNFEKYRTVLQVYYNYLNDEEETAPELLDEMYFNKLAEEKNKKIEGYVLK